MAPPPARSTSNQNVSSISSTALMPAGVDGESRPRNRRGPSANDAASNPLASRSSPRLSPAPSRGISPLPATHLSTTKLADSGRSSPITSSFSKGLLDGQWAPTWASVQELASSILTGGESGYNSEASRPTSRNGSRSRQKAAGKAPGANGNKSNMPDNWGPAPPRKSGRPKAEDIAAGTLAEREAALKARKTASVLESYEGVNGGLDVAGKYKRRNSDENLAAARSEPIMEDQLVYLHHVLPTDTYAGLILRYRCQDHAFRKTNGLWSRDNIQVRKHLMIPVDACEVKGRPCDPPNYFDRTVDHLATTPLRENPMQSGMADGWPNELPVLEQSSNPQNTKTQSLPEEEQPWTHVRWVKIDGVNNAVEIVRVPRQAVGFFPPRRKKSIRTVSAFSSPRQSLDLSRGITGGSSEPAMDSPGNCSSRRQSSIGNARRPTVGSMGTSSTGRSRGNSLASPSDGAPAWMRRPGGVGTMGRSTRAPGPAKDSLNTWVNKRLPKGFNIDTMPSMSVMGSESAHWGFNSAKTDDATGIVESPFEDGRDANAMASKQGMGLEQAAATVETWLRGAWAKRPSTPRLSSTRRPAEDLDLIELTDTNSDDGGPRTPLRMPESNLLNSGYFGTTGRNEGEGTTTHPVCARAQQRTMPICIECRHPVKTLWTQYSGAGDPSSGHNIRLTVCKNCGRFCDKYVEHDFVVLFIDLVLIKPQVYRHLLHNTLMREGDQFDPSIVRLGTLLLLFDVYLTWARIEKQTVPGDAITAAAGAGASGADELQNQMVGSNLGSLAQQPILSIRFLTSSPLSPLNQLGLLRTYTRPNSVSTALLVSSSTKLFPILMVIWDYDVPAAARSLGWAVVLNNVEALKILLDCGYPVALVLAAAGAVARWIVGRAILWVVGLEGVDSVSEERCRRRRAGDYGGGQGVGGAAGLVTCL
ncbi:Arv1-like family-domain-containing protein [Apiospora marii]|uniref:Protein ARV n=1 Tax=Apiospora marii TaxID=335849 RepID=A0ABR1SBW8_9PEZI